MLLLPFHARRVVMLVLVACLLDVTAADAATVEKIDKSRTKIMLNLTKDETTRLKVGDRIAIKDETGEIKATGSIVKIKKSQAMVQLDRVDVESGLKVEVVAEAARGSATATTSSEHRAEIEVASLPYASLFTDDGTPGADDTVLDSNSILPLPLDAMSLRFYRRFGDFALGPELAYLKHDLKITSKTGITSDTPEIANATVEPEEDKLAVSIMQAGVCAKYELGMSSGSTLGFVPRLCVGYVGKAGKSANVTYKDSGIYFQIGPGLYYKFGASVGLGVSLDYHSASITAKTIRVPDDATNGTANPILDYTTDSKETRTHLGIGYSLFFLF